MKKLSDIVMELGKVQTDKDNPPFKTPIIWGGGRSLNRLSSVAASSAILVLMVDCE